MSVYKTWKPKSSYWYLRNQWYFNICVVLYSLYYIFLLCILRVYNVIKYWLYLRYFDDKKKNTIAVFESDAKSQKKVLESKKNVLETLKSSFVIGYIFILSSIIVFRDFMTARLISNIYMYCYDSHKIATTYVSHGFRYLLWFYYFWIILYKHIYTLHLTLYTNFLVSATITKNIKKKTRTVTLVHICLPTPIYVHTEIYCYQFHYVKLRISFNLQRYFETSILNTINFFL